MSNKYSQYTVNIEFQYGSRAVVFQAFNSSTSESEAGGSLRSNLIKDKKQSLKDIAEMATPGKYDSFSMKYMY